MTSENESNTVITSPSNWLQTRKVAQEFTKKNEYEYDMAEKMQDQEFVEYIVKGIVNHPDDVVTERTVDEMGVLITLKINPEDMGYVIGRQGQTARAIRTLLKIVGAKSNARVNLKIYDPEGGNKPGTRPEGNNDIASDVEELQL